MEGSGSEEKEKSEMIYLSTKYFMLHHFFRIQDPYDTDRHQSVESAKLIEYLNSRASASPNLTTVPVLAVSNIHTHHATHANTQ